MRTFRFREFAVYQAARKFRTMMHSYLRTSSIRGHRCLSDQIERACVSIVLNIAEGSAKQSDKDFARFLEIAIASTNEVIAAMDCAFDDGIVNEKDLVVIERHAIQIARQLGGFLKTLRSHC